MYVCIKPGMDTHILHKGHVKQTGAGWNSVGNAVFSTAGSICYCKLQIHSYPLSPIGLCDFVLSCLNLVDTLPFFPETGRWQQTNMKYRMDRGFFFLYQNLSIEPSDFPIILKFPLSRRFFLLISSYSSLLPFLLRAFHCLIIYAKISIHSSFKKS